MGLSSIRIPDVGEGVAQVELVEWHVKPGDMVKEDDIIAAVMTDKATVEIPCLYTGTIVSLGAEIGETVAVGATLVTIEHDGEASEAGADAVAKPEVTAQDPKTSEPPAKAASKPASPAQPVGGAHPPCVPAHETLELI